jgi:hypothetical protein
LKIFFNASHFNEVVFELPGLIFFCILSLK